jgi:hypothetical protein
MGRRRQVDRAGLGYEDRVRGAEGSEGDRPGVADEGGRGGEDRGEADPDEEGRRDGDRRPEAADPLDEAREGEAQDEELDDAVAAGEPHEGPRDDVETARDADDLVEHHGAPDDVEHEDRGPEPLDRAHRHGPEIGPEDRQGYEDGHEPGEGPRPAPAPPEGHHEEEDEEDGKEGEKPGEDRQRGKSGHGCAPASEYPKAAPLEIRARLKGYG